MSDVDLLKQKAQALRNELQEIESAIAVFERHTGKGESSFSRLVSPLAAVQATQPISENFSTIHEWIKHHGAALNCRTALVGLLKSAPNGLSKQQLRDGLKGMGVDVEDSTLTWTLAHYTDAFDNFERGMYKIRPGNHL